MGKRQIIASNVGCDVELARSSIVLSGGRGVNRILWTAFRTVLHGDVGCGILCSTTCKKP